MSRKKHYYRKKRRKRTVPVLLALVVLILGIAGYGNGQADSISSALNTILTAASDLASGAEIQTAYAPSDVTEDLTVHFLDIGQGDCTLLTQGEHAMLIDAGDNDQGTKVQSYLEYLGISSLDYLVLTHPDADHIGGADVVIYKFDCNTILMPERKADTRTYDDVIQAMKSKNYTAIHPEVGDNYAFGESSFTILSPARNYEDSNDCSIVLRLTHGGNTFLFTGDAEEEAENDMLASGMDLSADVLKVGHHGSHTSTSDAFLDAVSPTYAVISCETGNSYGHPHAETLNKLRAAGVQLFRTDDQGTITVTSDGSTLTWNTSPSDDWVSGSGRTK